MKYKNHQEKIEEIATDIAKYEIKKEQYPSSLMDIEKRYGLSKLSTSSYYKWRFRELINEKKKELRQGS